MWCTRYGEIVRLQQHCCFLSFPLSPKVDCLARMLCLLVRLVLCFKCFKVAGSLLPSFVWFLRPRQGYFTLLYRWDETWWIFFWFKQSFVLCCLSSLRGYQKKSLAIENVASRIKAMTTSELRNCTMRAWGTCKADTVLLVQPLMRLGIQSSMPSISSPDSAA